MEIENDSILKMNVTAKCVINDHDGHCSGNECYISKRVLNFEFLNEDLDDFREWVNENCDGKITEKKLNNYPLLSEEFNTGRTISKDMEQNGPFGSCDNSVESSNLGIGRHMSMVTDYVISLRIDKTRITTSWIAVGTIFDDTVCDADYSNESADSCENSEYSDDSQNLERGGYYDD